METINKTHIAIKVGEFHELITGASLCAAKGKDAPITLNTIALSVSENVLTVRATDRYRLIEGKITLEESHSLPVTLISLADVKRIIDLMKGISVGYVVIELDDTGRLIVSAPAPALMITPVDGNFPTVENTDNLFSEPDKRESIESISFSPKLFADFGKISERVTVKFNGERKPITIGLDGDAVTWRALLMPMRSAVA